MSQTVNQSGVQPPKEPSRLLKAVVRAGQVILGNWPTKLLALVLAIALWAGLITQDPSLTRERTFRDVTVSINGSDTLRRNGLTVTSDLNALLDDVSVTVDVPQMQYNNATAANFNIRVDLSRIRESGEQEIAILTTNSSTYGKVTEVSPATVKVMVEATMYHDGKIEIVHSGMNMAEIAEARQDFLDNVEAGDDYDAIYTITEEGERYLDSLQSE